MRGGGECFYDEERREKWSNIAAFCVRNRNEYIITGIGTTLVFYATLYLKASALPAAFTYLRFLIAYKVRIPNAVTHVPVTYLQPIGFGYKSNDSAMESIFLKALIISVFVAPYCRMESKMKETLMYPKEAAIIARNTHSRWEFM